MPTSTNRIKLLFCIGFSLVFIIWGEPASATPWYKYYRQAEKLKKQAENSNKDEDWQAVIKLIEKAKEKDAKPEKGKRTYGAWRIDYYPYLRLGQVYLEIGNLDLAFKNCAKARMEGVAPEKEVQECLEDEKLERRIQVRGLLSDFTQSVVDSIRGRKVAVVIGINKYQHRKWRELRYAVNDALEVRDILRQYANYEIYEELYNEEATKRNILETVDELINDRNIESLIFYFAGHGDTRKTGISNKKLGYLIPFDHDPKKPYSTSIPMDEVWGWAKALPAKHVLFVFDACFSGLVGVSARSERNYELEILAQYPGRHVITAGMENQVALEYPTKQHGAFTYFLLEGLRGEADSSKDWVVTVQELYNYVRDKVAEFTKGKQFPQLENLSEENGELFLMIRRKN